MTNTSDARPSQLHLMVLDPSNFNFEGATKPVVDLSNGDDAGALIN